MPLFNTVADSQLQSPEPDTVGMKLTGQAKSCSLWNFLTDISGFFVFVFVLTMRNINVADNPVLYCLFAEISASQSGECVKILHRDKGFDS